jgi:SAM-dependent methyltransferase
MFEVARRIRTAVKDLSMRTGVFDQKFFKVYPYMHEPMHLIFLAGCVKAVAPVPGCFVEAGCAYGATTVFLNKYLNNIRSERNYYAFDTFSGFVQEHADYEIAKRGKPGRLRDEFVENKKIWFDRSMEMHDVSRVKSFQADISKFDFASIAPIAFCLLDVDLYRPIRQALPKIHGAMAPGGIIVVDDCKPNSIWDGAMQAYEEYVTEQRLPREIHCEKLGIIRA